MSNPDKRCGTCRHYETSVADIHGHQEGYCFWSNVGQARKTPPRWVSDEYPHPLTHATRDNCNAWEPKQ